MSGHHSHLEALAHHEHRHVCHAEGILEILGMAGETESLGRDDLLVERSRHEDVDVTFLEVFDCALQAGDGRLGGIGIGLSGLHVDVFRKAVDDIDATLVRVRRRRYDIGIDLLEIVDGLAVEAEKLRRAVYDRSEGLKDARVGECLDDDLVSDAVAVSLGDAHHEFPIVVVHIGLY